MDLKDYYYYIEDNELHRFAIINDDDNPNEYGFVDEVYNTSDEEFEENEIRYGFYSYKSGDELAREIAAKVITVPFISDEEADKFIENKFL